MTTIEIPDESAAVVIKIPRDRIDRLSQIVGLTPEETVAHIGLIASQGVNQAISETFASAQVARECPQRFPTSRRKRPGAL